MKYDEYHSYKNAEVKSAKIYYKKTVLQFFY